MTEPDLSGKTAIVTGAGHGIGAAYARALAEHGATVLLADIDGESAEAEAKRQAEAGLAATGVRTDVSDEASCAELVQTALTATGRVDILVNNAAMFAGLQYAPAEEMDVAYWRRVIDVNLTSVFVMSRAVIPAMKAQGGGHIVNQASTAAWINAPTALHYCTSKAGVVALTVGLARELGPAAINVNAIAPGPTDTDALRERYTDERRSAAAAGAALRRIGTPEDQAGALLFLVSPSSSWMTGQTLVVDGGSTFR